MNEEAEKWLHNEEYDCFRPQQGLTIMNFESEKTLEEIEAVSVPNRG